MQNKAGEDLQVRELFLLLHPASEGREKVRGCVEDDFERL
jgi:hypothetical protein